MRRFIYIPFIVAALLSLSSCENRELDYPSDNNWEVFGGYMQFATDVFDGVTTRAQLATDMRGKSFGVLGYQYSSTTNWGTAKPLATPTVFYNQEVSCDENGVCSYEHTDPIYEETNGLVPWDRTSDYTFFAYQPYSEKDTDGNYITGPGISLSGQKATNTPTLTYRYGWLDEDEDVVVDNSTTNPIPAYNNANIFDLMTAEAIDAEGSKGNAVPLEFNHRLFAIEVQANNFNENTYYYYRYVYYVVDENGAVVYENGAPKIAEWSAEPDEYMKIAVDDENNIIYETETVTEDGTTVTQRAKYSHDEGGGDEIVMVTDENGVVTDYYFDNESDNQRKIIKNLKLTLTGLNHTQMTIPLSLQDGEADPTDDTTFVNAKTTFTNESGSSFPSIGKDTGDTGVTFQISNKDVTIPAFNEEFTDNPDGSKRGKGVASSISMLGSENGDGYLMFIPQPAGELRGKFTWDDMPNGDDVKTEFLSTVAFEAGKLYQLIINFVGDSITIAIIEAGSWDQHTVYHTFE